MPEDVFDELKEYLDALEEPQYKAFRSSVRNRIELLSKLLDRFSDSHLILFGTLNLQYNKDTYYSVNRQFVLAALERLENAYRKPQK